jgi:hypothetical protein
MCLLGRDVRPAAAFRWASIELRSAKFGISMITADQEFQVTFDRISRFQREVAYLRNVEANPTNYHLSASGFLSEIDRIQLEVREFLEEVEPRIALIARIGLSNNGDRSVKSEQSVVESGLSWSDRLPGRGSK